MCSSQKRSPFMAIIYVSPTGNDNNTGIDQASAFQTLERALQAMHQSAGADTVYLSGGTHYVKGPIQLTAADSGSSFVATSGEKVVISGGTPVSSWTKGADGIWTAHVDADQVEQFTVNGVKQTESRFPNVDPNDPIQGGWLWAKDLPNGYDPQKSMAFNPSDFPAGHEPKVGQTISVFAENGYANDKLTIASIEGNVITFTSEANYDLGPASRFYVSEGTPDDVGEWSYDSATQTIRFKAPEGFTGEGGVVSDDHSLFVVDGAKDVTFKDLTFTDTAANAGDPNTAAIEVHDATGLKVEGNHFINVGVGVALHGDSSGNLVSGNSFEHTWSSAIALTPGTSGNQISNNVIDRSNEAFVQHGSISMEESARNQIDHNTITNVPRFGIAEINYDPGNPSGGNTIEYNDVRHSGQQTPDVGAIYLFSADDSGAAGDIIRYNHIVDTGGLNTQAGGFAENWSSGIYLDNMASNAQIYGNFVQGTTFSGILIHGGSNNQIHDNTLLDNGKYGISTITADDHAISGNQTYQNFIEVSEDGSNTIDTDQTDPGLIHDNVYYNPNGGELTIADLALAGFQQRGGDAGSVMTTQAGFVNAAAGDYGFVAGSAAQGHGIEALPFDSVGATGVVTAPDVDVPVTPPSGGGTPPVTPEPEAPATEIPPIVAEPEVPTNGGTLPVTENPPATAEPEAPSNGGTSPVSETPPITAEPETPQVETPVSNPDIPDVITIPEVTVPDTPSNSGSLSGWGGLGGGRGWFQENWAQRGDDDHGGGRNWFQESRVSRDDDAGGRRSDSLASLGRQDDGDNEHHGLSHSHWHW
ncbi:right-handed parallel beta-helix repeat-containing protein [Bosea sp. LjRoot237]|uniref:right-handed parallel beta-helix repeat-containing protein n=1 Tax=Bosea sp. LjRoot237 TaxID=3342292 RepID=UPI003ECC3C0F